MTSGFFRSRMIGREFLQEAIAISDAVDAGADPADPAVQDLLNGLVEEFDPEVIVGDEEGEIIVAGRGLTYANALGGDDTLIGSNQTDVLIGGDGNDFAVGGNGLDGLFGSAGNDILFGGNGGDYLDGGADNDSLSGDNGWDTLLGEEGTDTLDGGNGRDLLNGGSGADVLTGGRGFDRFVFDGDAFDGADVSAEGRQIIGNEDTITDFNEHRDRIQLDAEDFAVDRPLHFASVDANTDDIPADANVIVLVNSDNDDNPETPFLAGTAANQIADLVEEDGAGFFVYFNSNLNINRLVYSTNLNDADADLKIVARFTDVEGADAIAALQDFSAFNFDLI